MEISSIKPNKGSTTVAEVVEEKPKKDKVITSVATTKKRSIGSRIMDSFFDKDMGTIKDYIIDDVLIPSIKAGIADTLISTIEQLFGGGSSRSRSYSAYGGRNEKVSYYKYSDSKKPSHELSYSKPKTHKYVDVVLVENLWEAQEVIDSMTESMVKFGEVSVAEFKDLCGIPSEYTDNRYGWTDITEAKINKIREKGQVAYEILMPPVILLKD